MDDYFHKPSSVGTTAIGVELLIVNPENGNKTPQGQTGEVRTRVGIHDHFTHLLHGSF